MIDISSFSTLFLNPDELRAKPRFGASARDQTLPRRKTFAYSSFHARLSHFFILRKFWFEIIPQTLTTNSSTTTIVIRIHQVSIIPIFHLHRHEHRNQHYDRVSRTELRPKHAKGKWNPRRKIGNSCAGLVKREIQRSSDRTAHHINISHFSRNYAIA